MKLGIREGTPGNHSTVHTPVAIVGGGACGLCAALMLARAGIDCVVLERDVSCQGSTALSSGFIPAPATLAQKRAGILDSVELFSSDIQAKAKGGAARHLVQAYGRAIAPALDCLESEYGFDWQVLDSFLYPGHSAHRMHCLPEKTGAELIQRLANAAQRENIALITQAHVKELWHTNGAVTGLGFVRPDGSQEFLTSQVVLLACNGFGGNAKMVEEYLPEISSAQFAGHVGNDGSAVAWGLELGAALSDMNAYQGHGAWAHPHGILISWALMMQGGVQVNLQGKRFHDETQGYSEAAVHVLEQSQGLAWNVFDESLLPLAMSFPDVAIAMQAGAIKKCVDLKALAALIECDANTLEATLRTTQLQAPFYAVKVTGALFHTQGGLAIDQSCRVLRSNGLAFDNLLAAGGAAGGVSGNSVWGYLSGNGLLSAIAGGYIAANTAINFLQTPSATKESPS
jgi:fumarate reductase flavoprotein subunit